MFFPLVLAGIILVNRVRLSERRTAQVLLVLLLVAAIATVVETGVTNVLVLLTLIIALAGETFFTTSNRSGADCSRRGSRLLFAPGRIFWLTTRLMEAGVSARAWVGWGGFVGGCLLAVPALVLALIFGSLLATGNAVFGSWTNSFFDWFWKELALYLDFWRIALWSLAAFLAFCRCCGRSKSPPGGGNGRSGCPGCPEIVPARGAFFSSGLILVVLNLLFVMANIADALFLWSGQALPAGVTYSGFVHHGVNSLIVTVILSALVLTTIFQQALNVAQRRELKFLGLFWIAQNLFLLLSVVLRLKLYIEAYDMSVARLGVIIFLALVAGRVSHCSRSKSPRTGPSHG